MKCSKCGNEIKEGAKFCNICGEKLNTESSQPNVNLNKDESAIKAEGVNQPKKKNRTLIAVIGVVVVLVIGVALASIGGDGSIYESEEVTRVKKGHFLDYSEDDGYTDIGTAFESYFSDTSWESFTSEEGMEIVQFDGVCMYYDKETNCSIQFELDDDGGFSIYAMEFNGVPQNRLMIGAVVEDAMQESWGNDMND
ncbi:MAG: zinc-ribbon domain-containing protein [Intestinibacter sp.]